MAVKVTIDIGGYKVDLNFPNANGGVDLFAQDGGRFLEVNPGGGALFLSKPGSLAPGHQLEVGEDGRVVIHDA